MILLFYFIIPALATDSFNEHFAKFVLTGLYSLYLYLAAYLSFYHENAIKAL